MRILHTEASTGWGGQDMRVLIEALEMQRRGHDVTLACAAGCPLYEKARTAGLRVEAVEFGRKLNRRAVAQVKRLIRAYDIEIVNTHSSGDGWSGAVAARWARRGRRDNLPLSVRTRHLSIPIRPSAANRFLYQKLTDFIIVTGEALRDQLVRENGIAADRIVSIPTGVDMSIFDPQRWERGTFRREIGAGEDEFLWVMVAMIRRMKGHSVLAEAAALILQERPHTRFVIVGEIPGVSPVRTAFEETLSRLGIEKSFILTGYRDDIANILAGCDAAVLPSLHSEGVPQALTQALAMEKPVVATAVGSTMEIVRDGQTGLLATPNEPASLATMMLRIMDKCDAANEMGQCGRRLIQAHYSLSAMVDKVESVYSDLLQRAAPRISTA